MKRLSLSVLSVLAILAGVGCHHQPATQKQPQFLGNTLESVVHELGQPSSTEDYTIGEAVGEFRVELFNTYPPSNLPNLHIPIKEIWWDWDSYYLTIWFHQVNGQWVVLDTLKWRKDIRF